MSEYVHSNEFMFWLKAMIALQITKEGLSSFVENEMNNFLKRFTGDDAHFLRFLLKIVFEKDRVRPETAKKPDSDFQWTLRSKCTICMEMFKLILENNVRKGQNSINWECHEDQNTLQSSIHWWIVAKLYMPSNNKRSTGPKEVDPLSLFQLLVHCKLFEDERSCALEVIEVRNKLMYNSSNTIGEDQMTEAFKTMKALLKQKRIKPMSSKALVDIEKLEQERFILNNIQKENHDTSIQALGLNKKALMCEKNENTDTETSYTTTEKMLKETEKEIIKEIASEGKQVMSEVAIQDLLKNIISVLQKKCKDMQRRYEEVQSEKLQNDKETEKLCKTLLDPVNKCQTRKEIASEGKQVMSEVAIQDLLKNIISVLQKKCNDIQRRYEEVQSEKLQNDKEIEKLCKTLLDSVNKCQTRKEIIENEQSKRLQEEVEAEGLRQNLSDLQKEIQALREATLSVLRASCSGLKETLATSISADEKKISLHFDYPPRSMMHTLTSDVTDVLTDHAFKLHSDGKSQMILLENVSFGQKTLHYAFSTDDLVKVKSSQTENYSSRLTFLKLLSSSLESLTLDQSDVLAETDQFAKLIMLDIVCYSLVKTHDNIVEAYPSGTDDNILLIALTKKCLPTEIESFRGFSVLYKPYFAKSSESISVENFAQETGLHCSSFPDFKSLNEVVESHTDTLLQRHSNLEGIGSSMVRSTRSGYCTEKPCVVLYCRCKSYIPYGENQFPKTLSHPNGISFKTDVREGYCQFGPNGRTFKGSADDWHQELAMGCSVGPKQGLYDATLGPLLSADDIDATCFLTVRHMFQPFDIDDRQLQGTPIMQQADGDVRPNPYGQASQRDQEVDRECGEVLISTFNEFVDAAVVMIKPNRSPSRGLFVVPNKKQLERAGFSFTTFPTFDDGSTKDARFMTTGDFATERIIKFGKETGLTMGTLELNSMTVKIADEEALDIQYNGKVVRKTMKQQLKVNSHTLKPFFDLGDSGSAVFVVDKQNKLHCIGMAIGVISDMSCVVTPIQTILLELENKFGKKIVLKKFAFEEMQ